MKNMRFNHQKTWNIIDEWPQMGDLTKKQCDLLKDFGFRQRNGRQHFFFRNNFGLANNDRGSMQQKMAEMQTQDRESHSKMMGFWLKHGVPTHADLGLAFNPSNQRWETNFQTQPAARHGKDTATFSDCVEKNPVAGRLVCNFFAPGRRFKRTWTLWSTRPGNTEPSWGHCSINSMDPRLAASNKMYPLEWWRTRSLDWFSWEILKETTCFWWGKSWVSCRFSQVNPWNTTLWCGTWLNL